MTISDNTLKILKRAVKLDYSTPWQYIPDNKSLATGHLADLYPDINDPWLRERYDKMSALLNTNAQWTKYGGMTYYNNAAQYFPYHAATNDNKIY